MPSSYPLHNRRAVLDITGTPNFGRPPTSFMTMFLSRLNNWGRFRGPLKIKFCGFQGVYRE